jgi:hypothetical protein
MQSPSPCSPLFIVGSPRSGTSILVDALFAAGYRGYREGNLLTLISPLVSLIDRHYAAFSIDNPKVLISQVPKEKLKSELFQALKRLVEKYQPEAPWLDKTGNPEMIIAIPTLRTLWPESVFLFAKRRGIENVVSRLKKFPRHTFHHHCDDWARNMGTWRRVRQALPRGVAVEIDQQEIAQTPVQAALALAEFLRLDENARGAISATFQNARPQQTSEDTAHRLLTLDTTGWNEGQIEYFRKSCGHEMDAYGYNEDITYWTSTGGVTLSTMAPALTV